MGGKSFEKVVRHMQTELRCVGKTVATLGSAMKIIDRAINVAIKLDTGGRGD